MGEKPKFGINISTTSIYVGKFYVICIFTRKKKGNRIERRCKPSQ